MFTFLLTFINNFINFQREQIRSEGSENVPIGKDARDVSFVIIILFYIFQVLILINLLLK